MTASSLNSGRVRLLQDLHFVPSKSDSILGHPWQTNFPEEAHVGLEQGNWAPVGAVTLNPERYCIVKRIRKSALFSRWLHE
ncbi:MAG: hypothetical protein IPJ50_08865 [Betaproteobacteria bacterium]|nr:hypothetical protein [Betaproteobacteria bacterium]